jgi:hypothetical protein
VPTKFGSLLAYAVVVAAVLTFPAASWANSCSSFVTLSTSNPQALCVMGTSNPELPMSISTRYLTFASQSEGEILIYSNSLHTQLADIVTFTNVHGMATITIIPDSSGTTVPSMPILGTYAEGPTQGYVFLSLALTNGKDLHVGVCTSAAGLDNCNGGPASVRLSVGQVPEPGTLFLLGSGLIGSGAWTMLGVRRRKRQLTSS